jgi:hypothetical protein
MEKYSSDPVAEARTAIAELEKRAGFLEKTASEKECGQIREMLKAAKDRLKDLEG